jgi:hypothetical protein
MPSRAWVNRMVPSGPQTGAPSTCAAQIVRAGPPLISIFSAHPKRRTRESDHPATRMVRRRPSGEMAMRVRLAAMPIVVPGAPTRRSVSAVRPDRVERARGLRRRRSPRPVRRKIPAREALAWAVAVSSRCSNDRVDVVTLKSSGTRGRPDRRHRRACRCVMVQ